MRYERLVAVLLLTIAGSASPLYRGDRDAFKSGGAQQSTVTHSFISAEQLKAKLARNEAVNIIDVRSTDGYVNSKNKIKGAMYVKLRRLAYRLTMPPLKDIPRDRDIVTYCACPHDEASIRAAEILLDAGFTRVHVLQGGWQMWVKANGQTEARPRG